MKKTHFTDDTRRGTVSRGTLGLVALIAVGILAVTVWPTLYRYDRVNVSGNSYPVRTHRFSGKTEMLYMGTGWVELKSSRSNNPPPVPMGELAKLDGRLGVTTDGWLAANIYNGTSRDLDKVQVEVVVSDPSGTEVLRRIYELTSTDGAPLSSSRFIAKSGFSLEGGQTYTWWIVSATWG